MGKEMILGIKCIKKGCENKLNTDDELKKHIKVGHINIKNIEILQKR